MVSSAEKVSYVQNLLDTVRKNNPYMDLRLGVTWPKAPPGYLKPPVPSTQ